MTQTTRQPIRVEAEVLQLERGTGENCRLWLGVERWPGFDAGQFAMLSPGALGAVPQRDPLLPRPMAIYRTKPGTSDGVTAVEILFKVHGRGTALLADARPGQRVAFVGPLGRPFPMAPAGTRALLVAGGTGIASVYELARQLIERGTAVEVALGARSADDLMGVADFEALDLRLHIATEDGSRGRRGRVTVVLDERLGTGEATWVYACGPTPMMAAAAALAEEQRRSCWVSLENPMACGFGVCLGCAAPLRDGRMALVCRDGPVFASDQVAWEGLP